MSNNIKLGVKRLSDQAVMPKFAHASDACFDLHSIRDGYVGRNEHSLFKTGLAFDIPPGYALMIYSRSGHGFKNGVRLSNCVGVIDSGYIGEVQVRMTSDEIGMHVAVGERIAQAMLIKLPDVELVEVEELRKSERGTNGFGSTGQ